MFTPVFVSHHQFQVLAGSETGDYLGLYTVGDDLLQVTGRSQVTVLTGPHTGEVAVSAEVMSAAPSGDVDGWDAAAEASVWCPTGRVAICGLMGDCPDALADLRVDRPGLLRVRVHARHRRPDGQPPDPHAPERYRVCVWPVDEDTGLRSLRTDDLHPAVWTPDPARAAGWAMARMLALANPDPREVALRRAAAQAAQPEPLVSRVQVRRHRSMPAAATRAFLHRPGDHLGAIADDGDLVLQAGEVDIRIRLTAAGDRFAGWWRWTKRHDTATAVPDAADSHVDFRVQPGPAGEHVDLTVTHSGVRAPDAVLLGLVWDHLLDHITQVARGGDVPAHPWVPIFGEMAAQAAAQAEAARRSTAAFEAQRWGGQPPSERLRRLPANTIGLARLDRRLLDALADAAPRTQRAVARWAARQACAIAGLDTIEWIAAALTALDQDEPLPAPFDDPHQTSERLWADERVPHTTVTIPTGTPNCSQQAIALPAIPTAAHDDPLAAAVDTVYFAALAYGDRHRDLLTTAANQLAAHKRPP